MKRTKRAPTPRPAPSPAVAILAAMLDARRFVLSGGKTGTEYSAKAMGFREGLPPAGNGAATGASPRAETGSLTGRQAMSARH